MTFLKTEEEAILAFDVSDEALEIAGMVSGQMNFTFGVCTLDQPGALRPRTNKEIAEILFRKQSPAIN